MSKRETARELAQEKAAERRRRTPEATRTGPIPFADIAKTAAAIDELTRHLRSAVIEARYFGATWQEIATELGTTRQAAWERYA